METILATIIDKDEEHGEMYSAFMAVVLNQFKADLSGAYSLQPLTDCDDAFTYAMAETMAFQLTLQLQLLENRGFTLLFWRPEDILVVQASRQKLYLLISLDQRVALHKKDPLQMVIVYPDVFPLPVEQCAPELLKINLLPFYTDRSASYYSLALLCLKQLNLSLETIQDTKLFYFLERCLHLEPEKRSLIAL
jgi:hypothetical protein